MNANQINNSLLNENISNKELTQSDATTIAIEPKVRIDAGDKSVELRVQAYTRINSAHSKGEADKTFMVTGRRIPSYGQLKSKTYLDPYFAFDKSQIAQLTAKIIAQFDLTAYERKLLLNWQATRFSVLQYLQRSITYDYYTSGVLGKSAASGTGVGDRTNLQSASTAARVDAGLLGDTIRFFSGDANSKISGIFTSLATVQRAILETIDVINSKDASGIVSEIENQLHTMKEKFVLEAAVIDGESGSVSIETRLGAELRALRDLVIKNELFKNNSTLSALYTFNEVCRKHLTTMDKRVVSTGPGRRDASLAFANSVIGLNWAIPLAERAEEVEVAYGVVWSDEVLSLKKDKRFAVSLRNIDLPIHRRCQFGSMDLVVQFLYYVFLLKLHTNQLYVSNAIDYSGDTPDLSNVDRDSFSVLRNVLPLINKGLLEDIYYKEKKDVLADGRSVLPLTIDLDKLVKHGDLLPAWDEMAESSYIMNHSIQLSQLFQQLANTNPDIQVATTSGHGFDMFPGIMMIKDQKDTRAFFDPISSIYLGYLDMFREVSSRVDRSGSEIGNAKSPKDDDLSTLSNRLLFTTGRPDKFNRLLSAIESVEGAIHSKIQQFGIARSALSAKNFTTYADVRGRFRSLLISLETVTTQESAQSIINGFLDDPAIISSGAGVIYNNLQMRKSVSAEEIVEQNTFKSVDEIRDEYNSTVGSISKLRLTEDVINTPRTLALQGLSNLRVVNTNSGSSPDSGPFDSVFEKRLVAAVNAVGEHVDSAQDGFISEYKEKGNHKMWDQIYKLMLTRKLEEGALSQNRTALVGAYNLPTVVREQALNALNDFDRALCTDYELLSRSFGAYKNIKLAYALSPFASYLQQFYQQIEYNSNTDQVYDNEYIQQARQLLDSNISLLESAVYKTGFDPSVISDIKTYAQEYSKVSMHTVGKHLQVLNLTTCENQTPYEMLTQLLAIPNLHTFNKTLKKISGVSNSHDFRASHKYKVMEQNLALITSDAILFSQYPILDPSTVIQAVQTNRELVHQGEIYRHATQTFLSTYNSKLGRQYIDEYISSLGVRINYVAGLGECHAHILSDTLDYVPIGYAYPVDLSKMSVVVEKDLNRVISIVTQYVKRNLKRNVLTKTQVYQDPENKYNRFVPLFEQYKRTQVSLVDAKIAMEAVTLSAANKELLMDKVLHMMGLSAEVHYDAQLLGTICRGLILSYSAATSDSLFVPTSLCSQIAAGAIDDKHTLKDMFDFHPDVLRELPYGVSATFWDFGLDDNLLSREVRIVDDMASTTGSLLLNRLNDVYSVNEAYLTHEIDIVTQAYAKARSVAGNKWLDGASVVNADQALISNIVEEVVNVNYLNSF